MTPLDRASQLLKAAVLATLGLVLSQDAAAQEASKKTLRAVVKDIFGGKKGVPVEEVFSVEQKPRDLPIDPHLLLILNYSESKKIEACNAKDTVYLALAGDAQFAAWNEALSRYDTLARGLEIWDKANGYKGVFTYDPENDVIDIHNGGMDMENRKEFRFAAHAAFGSSLPGQDVAISYAEQGIADLRERFPQISKENTMLRFFGHSCGGPIALTGAAGMALQGYGIEEIILIDPYAATNALRDIMRSVAREDRPVVEAFIAGKVTTLNPAGGSWLDKMNRSIPLHDIAADPGRVVQVDIADERARHNLPSYLEKFSRK